MGWGGMGNAGVLYARVPSALTSLCLAPFFPFSPRTRFKHVRLIILNYTNSDGETPHPYPRGLADPSNPRPIA